MFSLYPISTAWKVPLNPSLSGWESRCLFCFPATLLLPDQSFVNTGLPPTFHSDYFNKSNVFLVNSIQPPPAICCPVSYRVHVRSRWCHGRKVHHTGPGTPVFITTVKANVWVLALVLGNVLSASHELRTIEWTHRETNKETKKTDSTTQRTNWWWPDGKWVGEWV